MLSRYNIVIYVCMSVILYLIFACAIDYLKTKWDERQEERDDYYTKDDECYPPHVPLPENWQMLSGTVREFDFDFRKFQCTATQRGIKDGTVSTFETLEDPRIPRTASMHEAWEARREKYGKIIYVNKFSKEFTFSFPKNHLNDPMQLVNLRATLLETDKILRCKNFTTTGVHASTKSVCDKQCDDSCYNHGYWFYDFPTHSMKCFTRYEDSMAHILADSKEEFYYCTCGHFNFRYGKFTARKKSSSFVECPDSKPIKGKFTSDLQSQCDARCGDISVMLKDFYPIAEDVTAKKRSKKDKDVKQKVIHCYDKTSKQELHSRRLSGRCDSRLQCHCGMPEKYLNRDSLMHIESAHLHPIERLSTDEDPRETLGTWKNIKKHNRGETSHLHSTHSDVCIDLENEIIEEISENSSNSKTTSV